MSSSLISLLSLLVIALIVWLILIFFSVTHGIEENWLKKLTSLHAPITITPTEKYYTSYYHQIDNYSSSSHFSIKSIGEKYLSTNSDPYSKDSDIPLSTTFPKPDLDNKNQFLDPVKRIFSVLEDLKKTHKIENFEDFEVGASFMKLQIPSLEATNYSQMVLLNSFCQKNPNISELIDRPLDTTSPFVLAPICLKQKGIKRGDTGFFSFQSYNGLTVQEQKIPFTITDFYDPGLFPMGSKCLLVPKATTSYLNAHSSSLPEGIPTNGIYVWTSDLKSTQEVKNAIEKKLAASEIAPFWQVQTFREYEFSKDLIQQFQSDRLLFSFISIIILIVACSNIISYLIFLVHDKKQEIAILCALGATKKNIATIFTLTGIFLCAIACLTGTLLAIFTLHHLDVIANILSTLLGHNAFNPNFYGDHLPNNLSIDALIFICLATPAIAFLSGLIPALKASKINPSSELRNQ